LFVWVGGHGVNAFYDAPQGDVATCLWFKDFLGKMTPQQIVKKIEDSDAGHPVKYNYNSKENED